MNTKNVNYGKALLMNAGLAVLLAALLLAGCSKEQKAEPVRPVVKTMRVGMGVGSWDRSYSGVVVARNEVQESFRVDGRIVKRLVDVGDRVRAGQVLAILDENDLRLSMESAQAELKAATANREQAVTDAGRYSTLLARNAVSHMEFEARRLAAEEAKGRLDRAERAFRLAQNRNNYSRLMASTDGVVTKVSAEAGQVVSPGQSVVSVAKAGKLEVLVDIPESQIQSLKDTSAEVSLWSSGEERYSAEVREIAPQADPNTRTFAVRFTLKDAKPSVRLGMTANLRLLDSTATPAARVPASALFNQGGGLGVWVVAPDTGKLTLKSVAVDRYVDQDAFVHGEIADGDIIVIAGVQKLDKNMSVRLVSGTQEQKQ